MVTGTRGVMDWFDRNSASPYYSVWCNRQLLFSWNSDDLEEGRNKLENDLIAIESNGVGDLLTIKLHPKKEKGGFITDKTPIYASLNFRPAELERAYYSPNAIAGTGSNQLADAIARLTETQNLILSKLSEEEFEEEEKEESALGKLINNPAVQGLAIGYISKMLGLTNVDAANMQTGIAGINEANEDEVMQIVSSLMDKGVTIDHLRKLDEMSTAKLSSLLIML
ncbi:MAG: hypothetical protein ACOVOQ_00635 [Flavobacterium sp.]